MTDENKTPWSKQRCRDFFVQNENSPSLRELALISGVAFCTLAKWSRQNGWMSDREKFLADAKRQVDQAGAEDLANQRVLALKRHSKAAGDTLETVLLTAKMAHEVVVDLGKRKPSGKEFSSTLSQLANILLSIASAMEKLIKLERAALRMDEPSIPDAIKLIEANGYQIADVDAAVMAESLTSKGWTVIEPQEAEAA